LKFLLDTHLLIWAANEPEKLSSKALSLMGNPEHGLFFSAASMWELAIKNGLGRVDFKVDARLLRRGLLDNDYTELPITSAHAVFVESLPAIHKDPLDRILIAQASTEGFTLLTADSTVAKYPGPIELV
jgi:PIN domain nuclease of toxin-antitoxin system